MQIQALVLVQAITLTVSVNHGLGRHENDLSPGDLESASQVRGMHHMCEAGLM